MLQNSELRAILNHVVGQYIRLEDCTEKQRARVDNIIKQRLTGMPLAKIIGTKDFWKHRFITTKDTLDPRPDSETLIEAVLKTCPVKPYSILDLGTGTGCLLISLLEEYPEATGMGVDISAKALNIAQQNSVAINALSPRGQEATSSRDTGSTHSVSKNRSTWIQSNWCEQLSGVFDMVVSNPPYIDPSELINEGASFDPPLALYGGVHTYVTILQSIDQHLTCRPQHLFFEIGHTQATAVAALLQNYSYQNIEIFKDLAGHDRVIHACG